MSAATSGKQAPRILNINVGVLGHVDSGKTSLVAALSTKLSTAALDKHPQSKERGITLDLGFSSFTVPMPEHLKHLPYDELQFTLVDCPGHASLIRTIIGGVQIIDMMILVVDITKGLQTQTAECLVVGEIATSRLVVALNKCDLLPPEPDRTKLVRKAAKRLAQTFAMTKFAGAHLVPVIAKTGGNPDAPGQEAASTSAGAGEGGAAAASSLSQGIEALKAELVAMVPHDPRPNTSGPLLFAIDHCFPIKGQGTVMTGTVLQGSIGVGDTIELPTLKMTKQVRSMQMFKQPVNKARQGDRVGVCVTQLDSTLIERGLACAPGSVPTFNGAIAAVEKIRFYTGKVCSKSKFHVSVGHTTVMADLTFFGLPEGEGVAGEVALAQMIENLHRMAVSGTPMSFDMGRDYLHQAELYGLEGRPVEGSEAAAAAAAGEGGAAAGGAGGAWAEEVEGGAGYSALEAGGPGGPRHYGSQWALLRFDQPVTAPKDALVIGARFDADVHGESCRLAFYGRLLTTLDPSKPEELQRLHVFKAKEKRGVLERIMPESSTAIVRGLFKKETDPAVYTGLKVVTGRGEAGVIESSFGKSGKLRVSFPGGLAAEGRSAEDNVVILRAKRYVYDGGKKKLMQ